MNEKNGNSNEIIRIINLVKKREKGGNVFELHVPDFRIYEGEVVAVVGKSGCGKSTLLDILALVLSPDSAEEFLILNQKIQSLNERKKADIRKKNLGYILQTGGLLPFLSVEENIYLPCYINRKNNVFKHVENLIEKMEIKNFKNTNPQFLSGGQRQRTAIARALSHMPSLVLADEPTASVDLLTAQKIIEEFLYFAKQLHLTILIVTHDLKLLENKVDRKFSFKLQAENEQQIKSYCCEIIFNISDSFQYE